ncbi:MAG: RNA polymerase factor sigma-70 [Rhodoferax sp.]
MTDIALSVDGSAGGPAFQSLFQDTAFLEDLRRQMLRFATLQLSDRDLAEDAVQEALIGAMRNTQHFAGRSAYKTWVFAILKNKIADTLRQRHRLVEASQLLHEDEEDEDFHELFDAKGFWQPDERPQEWAQPEAAVKNADFWRVFEACLERLPGQQARAFMMREFVELDTPEICSALDLSVSNLNVMLHRARLRLRDCLEQRWFLKGESHAELP